jgi:hypothetical protein
MIIEDGDPGAEWQRTMGSRHGALIHALPACGLPVGVDRGDAGSAGQNAGMPGCGCFVAMLLLVMVRM